MMLHIALIAEILATMVCIHCIYGRKIKWNAATIGTILGIWGILEVINSCGLGGIFSSCVYIILYLYCKKTFHSSLKEIFISLVLCTIVITSMQFISSSVIRLIVTQEYVRNVISNILICIVLSIHFLTDGMNGLQKCVLKKSKYILILIGFMCLVVLIILVQGKLLYVVKMQYFTLAIPAVFLLLY